MTDQAKPPVFLLDAMSFIFRAYHAMQRSRPMSTRSGLPTAATYVFVNMIKKLRQDFAPKYFAAVFDVSGEVFRDERARTMGPLRKWNSKTQSFDEVSYEGYKAKREAMPEDLRRQIPYIRRALEALRIPILEAEGFEADDVIGTLAREAAEQEHEVFIVSGDKDMMQLVTPRVKVLNPQKDNLILDPAKVTETLGVPPEKVVDVMALRGDSVDNIPGAPGIGDKGSVELIEEFGTVEAVLDRAAEVKRKSLSRVARTEPGCGPALEGTRHHRLPCAAARSTCTRWRRSRRTSKPAARCSPSLSSLRCCATWRLRRAAPPLSWSTNRTPSRLRRFMQPRASGLCLCAGCGRAGSRRNRRR